jgi:hypothetical protein
MHLRLHKSSIVVGFGIALLLLLVTIPGRVVDWSPGSSTKYEHGWPFVYLRRETVQSASLPGPVVSRREFPSQLPMWGIPWLSVENWKVWDAYDEDGLANWEFNGRTLVANSVLVMLALVAFVAIVEFRRRRRKNRFSFSLSAMFIMLTVAGVALGRIEYLKHESQRETAIIANFDESRTPIVDDEVCAAPVWIKGLIGEKWMPDFTWRARSVWVRALDVEDIEQLCSQIRELSYVDKLTLDGFIPEDHFAFATLGSIRQLKTLQVKTTARIDDRDISELSQLSGLKKIAIDQTISPERLSRLESALPNCKVVDADKDW